MSSCDLRSAAVLAVLLAVVALFPASGTDAGEFEASTAPDGGYLLQVFADFYYASAYFTEQGCAHNLTDVMGLLNLRVPVWTQYGITGAFSIGAMLPFDWVYSEVEDSPDGISRFTVHEFWATFQYRYLTCPFLGALSLRVKVPLVDKKAWYNGLRIGDGQLDLFPVGHLDYFSATHYWYVQLAAGYKYRFKKGEVKPHDEVQFYGQGGVELFPELRMRFYLFTDLIEFVNGSYPGEDLKFYEKDGDLHVFGYGVSLWPRPTVRVEMNTAGDWSGTNRYRGMRWSLAITKVF